MSNLFENWRKYLLLPAALFLAVGLGAGCSDDDDDDNYNGNGIDAQMTFALDGTQHTGDFCLAEYSIADGETAITARDGATWTLLIVFPGGAPGSFSTAGGASASLTIPPMHIYESEAFAVTVTSYGGIDGGIKGTFSGTLVHVVHENNVKQITNGTFTAQRLPNVD